MNNLMALLDKFKNEAMLGLGIGDVHAQESAPYPPNYPLTPDFAQTMKNQGGSGGQEPFKFGAPRMFENEKANFSPTVAGNLSQLSSEDIINYGNTEGDIFPRRTRAYIYRHQDPSTVVDAPGYKWDPNEGEDRYLPNVPRIDKHGVDVQQSIVREAMLQGLLNKGLPFDPNAFNTDLQTAAQYNPDLASEVDWWTVNEMTPEQNSKRMFAKLGARKADKVLTDPKLAKYYSNVLKGR